MHRRNGETVCFVFGSHLFSGSPNFVLLSNSYAIFIIRYKLIIDHNKCGFVVGHFLLNEEPSLLV